MPLSTFVRSYLPRFVPRRYERNFENVLSDAAMERKNSLLGRTRENGASNMRANLQDNPEHAARVRSLFIRTYNRRIPLFFWDWPLSP